MEMHAIHALASPAKIEAGTDGEKIPTLSSNSYNGGLIRVPRYDLPIAIDLDGISGLGQPHPIYRNHDESKILGSGVTTRVGNSLQTEGVISNEGEHVDEVIRLGKHNYPYQASVGNQPTRLEKIPRNKAIELNGQTLRSPIGFFVARKSYLTEVSVVSSGADRTTTTTIAASAAPTTKRGIRMDFENYVADLGFTAADLTEKQLNPLRAAYDNQRGSDGDVQTSIDKVLEAARDKEQRGAAYGRIIASAIDKGMDSETAEKLVEAAKSDSLSPTEFELQVLRLGRHQGSTRTASNSGANADVIEAALGMSAGLGENDYSPELLEAADKQFKNGLGLGHALQLAARANGHSSIDPRDTRALLTAAFAPVQASGASTYDLSGILSNIANKSARRGYLAVEQEWRKIASIRSVSDLKEHKAYSLTGDMEFKRVGAGGELKHAELGEEAYSISADTYGRIFSITRRDILNDDLQAFNQVRTMLGRGAALAVNRVVWTEWLNNAGTHWAVGRKNYMSGASSALDIDSLSTAVQKFEEQADPDGNPLGLNPAVLVVPSALKVQGMRIASDTEIRQDGNSAKTSYFTKNPWAGQFELCASQYLNNAKIPGGSATHWWLAASPDDTPSIEVAFLNGRQVPAIDQANADFDTLGVKMRAYFDFGASKQDYRASVMSAGA